MGRTDGFLLYERREDGMRRVSERIRDFREIHAGQSQEERCRQAARCMNCGVPFCQSGMKLHGMVTGCPLHNLIPEWNDAIYRGHNAHALKRLLKTNPFPEFTGRVCPALCEKACLNGLDGSPVTIRDNERFLAEYGYSRELMKPSVPAVRSQKRVGIVGSGPAGLAAAHRLNQRGHNVVVYEREKEIGGLLTYGIPNMKLDKSVIKRRRKKMEAEGIVFLTGIEAGRDISLEELRTQYDALILACGAKQARIPELEGIRDTSGVILAVDFLGKTTAALPALPKINAKEKQVVVLGGGDTGNDCVGTCIRQGCRSVVQIEMMPKPPETRSDDNPWPEWPKVLKTDYGQEEAICLFHSDPRLFSHTVTSLIQKEGVLQAIEIAGVHFENGKQIISEKREQIPCDLLIIAAGFTGCEMQLPGSIGIQCTERNTIATEEGKYSTSVEGIFTAGDMHRGQSLVVWAIREGLLCAKEVDSWMMGYTNLE
ncbi:MAG: glutamate synthase subunit beta [Solobacterium sp.]|nr:glutamate synthase subunit beta [Solobacterium sp.]